ncbi:MAG: outer membrane beta-barrel protein [Ramlibacter sp.]|nr:outer membrane beta-barrel protein [Ramlibacter sp.]
MPGTYGGMPSTTPTSSAPSTPANIFQFRAGLGVEHDSNVFRQPAAQSDTIGSLSVGFKADRRIGLQRFRGDIEATAYKFRNFSTLDYNTLNYNVAWDWSFTPALHGVISADRRQYRETYFDTTTVPGFTTNRVGRRTERTELAEGVYELGAAWRLLAGVAHTSSKSSEPGSWDASPSVNSAHVGAGYEFASGRSITARLRRGDGEYSEGFAGAGGDFRETEADVLVKWPLTGKTAVEGRLGRLERTHSGAPQRDFDGFVGNASLSWDITGKTRLQAGLARNLNATGQATGGYVQSTQVWIGPRWTPTALTAVNLRYERTARDWRDVTAGSIDAGRHEIGQAVMAGFEYTPRSSLAFGASLRNERLKSNLINSGYRATIFGVTAKAYF